METHLCHVKLVGELVKDGSVAVLVLLDDGGDEGDQLVPELQVVEPGLVVLAVSLRLVGVNLEKGIVLVTLFFVTTL
jgi:hypothetical protein